MTLSSAAPVIIVAYDPRWPEQAAAEQARIWAALGADRLRLEHVGSTSVPGLAAKPIIDLLGGVRALDEVAAGCLEPLRALGYAYVPEYEIDLPERRYFHLGPAGARQVHLHIVATGGAFWERHLLFRDYLRAFPEQTAAYAAVKRELAERYRHDRGAYTAAKTDFIQAAEARARAWRAETA